MRIDAWLCVRACVSAPEAFRLGDMGERERGFYGENKGGSLLPPKKGKEGGNGFIAHTWLSLYSRSGPLRLSKAPKGDVVASAKSGRVPPGRPHLHVQTLEANTSHNKGCLQTTFSIRHSGKKPGINWSLQRYFSRTNLGKVELISYKVHNKSYSLSVMCSCVDQNGALPENVKDILV